MVVGDYNLPLHFWDGRELFIVPPDFETPRFTTVVASAPLKADAGDADNRGSVLKLSDIDDRTTAQKLVGRFLLVSKDACPDAKTSVQESAVGLEVIDLKHGRIGIVVEERFGKAQELWVVKGCYGEVLIPAVDDFIVESDGKTVTVELPEGLLELNARC